MRRKILGSALAIMAVLALTAGTFAAFSDEEVTTATMSTGTLDLVFGTPTSETITVGNIQPGYSGNTNIVLRNAGTVSGDLEVTVVKVSDVDNRTTPPGIGVLGSQLQLNLATDPPLADTVDELNGEGADMGALEPGGTTTVNLAYELPHLTENNDVQGTTLIFELEFMLTQNTAWSQGFETGVDGWLTEIGSTEYGTAAQVASGTNGITSSDGSFHAVFNRNTTVTGPFSRFDGYRSAFPADGYTASLDVYLDPAWPVGAGFDYSVASSTNTGGHLRDFIIHVGVHSTDGLLVNGSNNSDPFVNDFKLRNDGDGTPYEVTSAGWYTIRQVFKDAGGVLSVDIQLLDADGDVVFTTTRSNAADTIPAPVGGNRYGWFTHISGLTNGLAVDNHQLSIGN